MLGQFPSRPPSPQAKADMLSMVQNVETALEQDIKTLPWMTDATKQRR